VSRVGSLCQEVGQQLLHERNTLTMDPACALTAFCCVDVECSIADNARKTDATLTLGGHCFSISATHFCSIVNNKNRIADSSILLFHS